MPDSVRVLIIEDDTFARNWMTLLLARDWRTYVAADVADPRDLASVLEDPKNQPLHLALLDIEMPADPGWLTSVFQKLAARPDPPGTLALATHVRPHDLRQLMQSGLSGFVLKQEIHHSLAWAVALSGQGRWVMTPGVEDAFFQQHIPIPPQALVMDGRTTLSSLSRHEVDVARMALLYSLERNDLAQELGVSSDWSYGLVSSVYTNLGLIKLLDPREDPNELLAGQKVLIAQLNTIRKRVEETGLFTAAGHRKKVPGLESLMFHYLTMPDMH